MNPVHHFLRAGAILAAATLCWTGCDLGDDHHFDHVPPADMGALIIDNYSGDDVEIFVGGRLVGKVNNGDDRPFDLQPGAYRLVVNDENDDRHAATDLDILESRLTVVSVRYTSGDYEQYDLEVDIE